ncbi:mycofactocin system protein MftB [Pseudonocardia sp. CNS-139]|nr:mycofactocin system protein MftB [Pseudonocardia sp. CNS-139]
MPKPEFDPELPYRASPRVAVRPEPFGRSSTTSHPAAVVPETQQLVEVVTGLATHDSALAALDAAGVEEPQRPAYLRALAGLAANGTIEERA